MKTCRPCGKDATTSPSTSTTTTPPAPTGAALGDFEDGGDFEDDYERLTAAVR